MIGKIQWWSKRDGNGIIEDSAGNEFYFDVSVTNHTKFRSGDNVKFIQNLKITCCPCARDVVILK